MIIGLLSLGPANIASSSGLEKELGRSEVRIRTAAIPLAAGRTVWELALEERLDALDYRRVRQRPAAPGEYFWGHEAFWIFRHAHRLDSDDHPARLVGLVLRRADGKILAGLSEDGTHYPLSEENTPWLEPETLAESLNGDRAVRVRIALDELPEQVWRPVLAAEDARFFAHDGVDSRSLARALLANVRAGKVAQGGSTITQQLIKNRDLTPKRTLGRKVSEALRSLMLEAEHDKREILEAYLNLVYLGHVDGLAIHGLGTAAETYFSKPAAKLDLAEAALLAAMIQGPNRLSPTRHAERVRERRDWVLSRLEELGWVDAREIAAARRRPIELHLSQLRRPIATHFLSWLAELTKDEAPRRLAKGRGLVVESELDPHLQRLAERVIVKGLGRLRQKHRRLAKAPLSAALISLDVRTGGVVAYVGGHPGEPRGGFDRARSARRQPGSTIKPLLLLEAFERCGGRDPLYPATRVADEPLRLELPTGPWEPTNNDGSFAGIVDLRQALKSSLNVPFVRVARWCDFASVADRLRRGGLGLPKDPPPAFSLGAVETTPLELARAYTVLAAGGQRIEPRPIRRLERPKGLRLERFNVQKKRVVAPETAYLIADMMRDAVRDGTARAVQIEGQIIAAKTGTSSDRRDAWLAGQGGSLVTVLWLGRDDDGSLGLSAAQAAAPLWKEFMQQAILARPQHKLERPPGIVTFSVDPRSGLRVRQGNRRGRAELFRRGAVPPRHRFWLDRRVPIVR